MIMITAAQLLAMAAALMPSASAFFALPPSITSYVSSYRSSSFAVDSPFQKGASNLQAAATATSVSSITFDEMKSIESRLITLEKQSPEILSAFYEPHLKSFSVRPGSTSSISVTSTCFALQTLVATGGKDGNMFNDYVDFNMKQPTSDDNNNDGKLVPLRGVLKALLRAPWREEDLFQVPLLLYTVLEIDSDRSILNSSMDEELCHKVKQLVAATINSRPRRRNGVNQPISDYILFLVADSLASLVESTPASSPRIVKKGEEDDDVPLTLLGNLPASVLPDGAASSTLLALTRCVEVSYNELCRQLAFRSAGDSTSFDVIRLAYSLLTYIRASNAMAGTAGREVIQGEGPAAGTAVGAPNKRLIKAALDAFFAEQNPDGTWDKGQPIFVSFRRKRDVGNAFVFAADTVGSLLEALPAEDFRPHLDGLEKLLSWIEQHKEVEIIPDYCDPQTGQCYGKPLSGWNSPHMTSNSSRGPAAWSTAQTITCIMRMKKVVQRLLHIDVLEEFRGTSNNGIPKLASWDRLLDTDLGDPSTPDGCRTLKDVLNERMVQPFSSDSSLGIGVAYSSILFGPPGTAKSTICEALAERMGWDFLTIDTATFLEDGLTNVASRIRYVFARLQSLNNCVILFDEIEEFCLDRENPGLGMESRMLTTAMLTAINDLRRAKKSIFFLATNRLRAFDSAIIRPGRFDMQLFVGTPNLEARVIQLRGQLASLPLQQSVKDETEEAFRKYLSSVWTENVMFFNYLEGVQFATACARVVASGEKLTAEKMEEILKAQAVVMTVRGQVRDEYVSSMNLSRL